LEVVAEPGLFGLRPYSAAICSSANYSGDPAGSIVEESRALAFARERGVSLVVRCEPPQGAVGSYPILWLRRDRITVERLGPGLEAILARLPAHLRPAVA
jgi:hypothetical protein